MTAKCILWHEFLTYGKDYYIHDRSGNSFKVINNLGNYQWIDIKYFQW